jgi:integrase
VATSLISYEQHLTTKGNRPTSVTTTRRRLEAFFDDVDQALTSLTVARCKTLYGKASESYAVDSHRNMLAEAKTFLNWCVLQRWLARNPLDTTTGIGRRRHGKPQLRIDEARTWLARALELARGGNEGATAALCTMLLGMRAGEVVSRVVRDVDDGGRRLWIPDSKTEAGRRTLEVPELLQPLLLELVAKRKLQAELDLGQDHQALLFGAHWRDWPRECVQTICRLAKVPVVTAHGMRGLHATLALAAGQSGHQVAAALGHESVSTTEQSYAAPGAAAGAAAQRAWRVLDGGKR